MKTSFHSMVGIPCVYTKFRVYNMPLIILQNTANNTIILIKIFQIENNSNALCLPGISLYLKHRQNATDIMETQSEC